MATISHIKPNFALRWRSLTTRRQLWVIFALAVILFSFIVILDHRIVGSDDTVFILQTAPYHTIAEWVSYRYQTWSGRIIGEGTIYIFSNLPLIYWQIVTIFMYALFTVLTFCYYRLIISPKQHARTDAFALIAGLILPYALDKAVFSDGILWVTGGMVYFWSFVLMLLALYAPTRYLLGRRRPSWWLMIISFLSTIIVTLSSEQAGITLITCLGCLSAVALYKRARFRWYTIALLGTAIVSFVASLKAPGNIARLHAETATWLPDFYTTPLSTHINDSLRWILDALVNHTGVILIILWLCLVGLLLTKEKRSIVDKLLIALLVTASVVSLARGFDALQYWTQFHATWHAKTSMLESVALIGVWITVLLGTILTVIRALPNITSRVIIIILILCGYGTTTMMTLSPTMYASSWRSVFVPSMLLGLASLIAALSLWRHAKRRQQWAMSVVTVYAFSHYTFQLASMIAHK